MADGLRRGLEQFGRVGPTIVERISSRLGDGSGAPTGLDCAQMLLAVQGFDGPRELREDLSERLVEMQGTDGSWPRSVFYYGGPKEVFGWASEALSTAYAIQALSREVERG
jgi:hypothetical protein